jgi:glucose-1-phosphate adenylyltransferase
MSVLMNRTLVALLAGGAGERLYPLTRDRAKPAVPFGGNYRIIDLTLSNCINSGLRKIFAFTQYKSLSLNRHIRHGWYNVVAKDLDEFIEVIPPQQRVSEHWYQGTADAVYQNLYSIRAVDGADLVLILSGDQIYKMNYFWLVRQHVETGADVTIGAIEVPISHASRFGIMEVNTDGRVIGFEEKPNEPVPFPGKPDKACASMGIYVFGRLFLEEVLRADAEDPDSRHDFGKNVIPKLISEVSVYAHHFVDENRQESQYWRDVGTIDTYYEANLDLIAVQPQLNLYDKNWPIRTYQRQYPPAKFVFADEGTRMGTALDSIVSAGCIVSGGRVERSVLSPDVRVNSYSHVEQSILFPHVVIGRHSKVRRAIVDRGVVLPEHTVIGYDPDADRERYAVSEDGIVVVSPEPKFGEENE